MKVGIITYHNTLSYGAHLQAFALQEAIKTLGHDVQIVDYRGNVYSKMSIADIFASPLHVRSTFANANKYRMIHAFSGFNENFILTNPYDCSDSLRLTPPDVNAYVVGSDQVWQLRTFPDGNRFDRTYFLDFARGEIRRIAYAPSFGHCIDEKRISEVLPLLDKFDSLSVREPNAAQRLSELLMRPVQSVCDPTILFGREGFDRFLQPKAHAGVSGFCYLLSWNWKRDVEVVRAVKKKMGKIDLAAKPIQMVFKGRNFIGDPFSWVQKIRDAKFVITNSFHGTVFSILYHRPFVYLPWSNPQQNLRIEALLEKVGLSNWVLSENHDVCRMIDEACEFGDWYRIDEKIKTWRDDSHEYLVSSLKEHL